LKTRQTLLLFFLFLCKEQTLFSQPDSILSLPSQDRVLTLMKWYNQAIRVKDSQHAVTELIAAEKLFTKNAEKSLQQQAWLLRQLYTAETNNNIENSAAIMLKAAANAYLRATCL
jgi:hypothetical protein